MTSLESAAVPDQGYRFPLSYAQQRLWFLDRLEPGSSAYNIPLVLRLHGPLDTGALRGALDALVERHESLRTIFMEEEGEPFQIVRTSPKVPFEVVDLEKASDPESRAQELLLESTNLPFALQHGVFRVRLLRTAPQEHLLSMVVHHIAADAWSMNILRRDLGELYRACLEGRLVALPELEIQYGDFAVWQREWLAGERHDQLLAHWREALAGAPALLELPTDRPRPPRQSNRGHRVRTLFPAAVAERLETLSREEDCTLFMTLLAGFATILSRYTRQRDIVVGSPVANRQRVELEPVIGFFANTLALRLDLSGDPTFRELQRRARTVVLDALAHQDLPFEQLVADLNPDRSLSYAPLFQVLFQVQMGGLPGDAGYGLPELDVSRIDLHRGTAKFDLALTMSKSSEGLHASLEYSSDLFDAETAERILDHLRTFLEAMAEAPDRPLSHATMLSSGEREQLRRWNDTTVNYRDAERCVHELVELEVERSPDRPAVAFGRDGLTYRQLNARANHLALRLQELGVGRDKPVAISLHRSLELVIAVLAVLKAGGAYMPLDPAYPNERLQYMMTEGRPRVLLTTADLADQLPGGDATVLLLDTGHAVGESQQGPQLPWDPNDLAYVLFTSGSTGWPKGVAMPHRTLTNLLLWQREHFSASPDARTLQFASLSFDVAFQEIFSTLTSGGTLVLVDEDTRRDPEALLRFLDAERIERLFMPFAGLQHLAEASAQLDHRVESLREVITAGETLQATDAIRRFLATDGGCVLHNQYGPTESHVVTAFRLDGDPARWPSAPPIGRPIANARIHILDANDQPLPVGIPGQLYIGGSVLARGYLNRPDLTTERFIPDPRGAPGERLYRTGDLARLLRDGNVEFLGRIDHQVKLRGYRVELGEVEAVLLRHDLLGEVAAVVRDDAGGDPRLVAYVVPKQSPGPDVNELRAFAARHLPEFMVPSAFVVLDALPLGPTGKIDRLSLPAPDRRGSTDDEIVPPREETERVLVEIWRSVLGLPDQLGVTDDFFALGGHSLLAVRLIAKVERALGVRLPLATLFEAATIERMAERVRELRADNGRLPTLTPLKSTGTKPPLFLLHGRDGELMIYRNLVRSISPDQPIYGIQPIGLDGQRLPFMSIEEMAAHYVAELRSFLPNGPYLLAGYCFSGVLAYELAHQLAETGHAPDLLALIDASPAGYKQKATRRQIERAKLRAFFAADLHGKVRWIAKRARGVTYKLQSRALFALYDYASRGGRWVPRPLVNVEGAMLSALRTYRTPKSSLHVTLLRGVADECEASPRSHWTPLAGDVEVRHIAAPGIQHDNIVREPYVALLAAELEACMESALACRSLHLADRAAMV